MSRVREALRSISKPPGTERPPETGKSELEALRQELAALKKIVDHQGEMLTMLVAGGESFDIERNDQNEVTRVTRNRRMTPNA